MSDVRNANSYKRVSIFSPSPNTAPLTPITKSILLSFRPFNQEWLSLLGSAFRYRCTILMNNTIQINNISYYRCHSCFYTIVSSIQLTITFFCVEKQRCSATVFSTLLVFHGILEMERELRNRLAAASHCDTIVLNYCLGGQGLLIAFDWSYNNSISFDH